MQNIDQADPNRGVIVPAFVLPDKKAVQEVILFFGASIRIGKRAETGRDDDRGR